MMHINSGSYARDIVCCICSVIWLQISVGFYVLQGVQTQFIHRFLTFVGTQI